jgi:hypothetical protein
MDVRQTKLLWMRNPPARNRYFRPLVVLPISVVPAEQPRVFAAGGGVGPERGGFRRPHEGEPMCKKIAAMGAIFYAYYVKCRYNS